MSTDALIVLDIGKTNAKLALIDTDGRILAEQRRPNTIRTDGPYPHHDVDGIWDWLLATCRSFARMAHVTAIVPVTHGATAALVDETGLVLPVLDYETPLADVDYEAVRPPYEETCSPDLPAGLNLGRQLAWLAQRFPMEFSRTHHILMYPQYWGWRLGGAAAAEVTSLGCHTDLWDPVRQRHSSLVARMDWQRLMPPLAAPGDAVGRLSRDVSAATGLPPECEILCGIHDSNASLLRYLRQPGAGAAQTVLSTGTWLIAAAFGTPLARLREQADMLANTSAFGEAVACMRFMAGREFAALSGPGMTPCARPQLAELLARGTMALPCFADAGGPFAGARGQVTGPAPTNAGERYALATLYCVLMTDYCLDALASTGPIAVEGSFTANPHFGALLAALRPTQPVTYSDDTSGTTCGGWMLRHRDATPPQSARTVEAWGPPGLAAYRRRWRAALDALDMTGASLVTH
jgi:sugar (pentulose or hexulose) kinase